jgi:molybdopterin-guanine dinucleotide biosynthesis protein A
VAHRLLTGVLLVGGASERFGSPKALARIDGETLAERAFATLAQACDEVVAVGKVADGLELPFPLLDDGSEGRAPVFGVVAGLGAAAHDVCVVLPVDCPLVTPSLLRALGKAVAVPQTGPLPGAYSRRESLAALRARIARGELSLRGVNRRVLEVDPRLVADVDTPAELAQLAVDRSSHFRH